MLQIINNYIAIVILPLFVRVIIRLLLRRTKYSHLITIAFVILAITAWIVAHTVFSYGSELYGLLAIQATCLAVGALLTGVFMLSKKSK